MNAAKDVGHKKLYRSADDKRLSGVCGGIGEFFGIDPTLVRIAWIILTAITGILPGIIAYIVAAVVIPREPEKGGTQPGEPVGQM